MDGPTGQRALPAPDSGEPVPGRRDWRGWPGGLKYHEVEAVLDLPESAGRNSPRGPGGP